MFLSPKFQKFPKHKKLQARWHVFFCGSQCPMKMLSDHHSTIDCLIKMANCSFLGQKLRAQKPPDIVVVMKTGQKARKKIKFSEESIICLTTFHKAVQISSEKPIEPLRKPGKWSPRMYPTKNRFHTKWHLSSCQTISLISGIKSQSLWHPDDLDETRMKKQWMRLETCFLWPLFVGLFRYALKLPWTYQDLLIGLFHG